MENQNTILVGVSDVFFYAKIRDAYRPQGYTLARIRKTDPIVETVVTKQPAALILNMNDDQLDATAILRTLKQDERTSGIPVLAFANHEEIHLWKAAKELGIHTIVSRNEFSSRTLALLEEMLGVQGQPSS